MRGALVKKVVYFFGCLKRCPAEPTDQILFEPTPDGTLFQFMRDGHGYHPYDQGVQDGPSQPENGHPIHSVFPNHLRPSPPRQTDHDSERQNDGGSDQRGGDRNGGCGRARFPLAPHLLF